MNTTGRYQFSTQQLFLVFIGIVSGVLLLANLDDQLLWQDEAQSAMIATTILQDGIPRGYDGKNHLSQEYGAEYGEDYVWKWHTWLSFYLVAASFEIFGENTFAARFPSVLFGLGTVFLTYFFSKALFRSQRIAVLATVLLTGAVPFLLLSRQCRYYSPAIFFFILALFAYVNGGEGKRYSTVTFVAAVTFLFHTHYIYTAVILASVFLHMLLFRRERWRSVTAGVMATMIINMPWIVWLSSIKYEERYSENLFNIAQIYTFGVSYHHQIISYLFPLVLLVIPGIRRGVEWANSQKFSVVKKSLTLAVIALISFGSLWFLNTYLAFYLEIIILVGLMILALSERSKEWENIGLMVIVISITFSALLVSVPFPFFRYLGPLIPIVFILMALLLDQAFRVHWMIGLEVTALVLVFGQMRDYVGEITHDYSGPMTGIVDYLQTHGSPSDTVVTNGEYLPIAFYTDMKVVGGLAGEDPSPYTNAQWIILRKFEVGKLRPSLRDYLVESVRWENYESVTIPYPDIRFETREDPRFHMFRTEPIDNPITIFRRRR